LDILSDDWTIKKFAVVGLGRVVGLPLFQYLQEKKYSVEKVTRWGQFTNGKKYDVIISAAGSPMLIVGKEIKEDTILIDYGCSPYATVNGVQKFCGDFDVSCYEKCKHYTPVPGCMGPLVVASLFENVLKSIKTEN
jgi:methylenetetrahydrofolate dehydrogenase (NADP+)/methenyltetrahydrofolate cyclohydrolase